MSLQAPQAEAGSRPSSEFDDLPLSRPTSISVDPWQSSQPSASASSSKPYAPSPPAASLSNQSPSSSSRPRPPLHSFSSDASGLTETSAVDMTKDGPLVLGVAVVDFNHLIGPTVEFAYPESLNAAIVDDDELGRTLPFLALPDGAHLSEEDYSYFHCTYQPSSGTPPSQTLVPPNRTLFGISCNRQIAAADLKVKSSDVTRSMVQKAVVVIASQPVFGVIRDQLGIVTRTFFAQRDFSQTDILEDFYRSLEDGLEGKSGEQAIYMGTSLRELIHKFRHRTLVMLKMLMLQKRVMLFGYPVEMLCTYQYSLVSLIPGLLMNLRDCGIPDLNLRTSRAKPTSLRSSDRGSLLRYMGLPLHVFGNDAFFQPYLPLQQMDMLQTASWLVGTTNQIVTQQKDCKFDLLVNIENVSFEFSDPKLERAVALTPWDRKWMDDVVRTVEETYNLPETQRPGFRGSDDDLRARFEEYICAVLASIKYSDFLDKSRAGDIMVSGAGSTENVLAPFSEVWIEMFRRTNACETWEACTDPVLFDLCEPRHPCDGQASIVSDIGLRITEGLHDLKLEQQLGPTREALSTAFATGSASFFKAYNGVRSEVSQRLKEREEAEKARRAQQSDAVSGSTVTSPPTTGGPQLADVQATLSGIGKGIGGFFGTRLAGLRGEKEQPKGLRPLSLGGSPNKGLQR